MTRDREREMANRSMVDVRQGQGGIVRQILFDTVRSRCAALGIREGSRFRCTGSTPGSVTLEVAGRTLELERTWSYFVQVELTPARMGMVAREWRAVTSPVAETASA
jgi:Fe2+ transport system protein FeoA